MDLDDPQQRGPPGEGLPPDLRRPRQPGPGAAARLSHVELRLPRDDSLPGGRLLRRDPRLPRLRLLGQAPGRLLVHAGGRREARRPFRPRDRGTDAVQSPDPRSRRQRRLRLPGQLPGPRREALRDHLSLHLQRRALPSPRQPLPGPVRHPARGARPRADPGAAGPAPGDGGHAATGRQRRHPGVQRRDRRAALRGQVPAGEDRERVPLAGQPAGEPDTDGAHLGASRHREPAPHRQPHLVRVSRQAGGGEQLLAAADGRPLPATGRAGGDGGDRPRLPGGGHPRPRGRERVHAGPGPEPDRDLTRLHGALHHRERPLPGRRRYSPDGYSF